MTRKERLVRKATEEILSEVYHLSEDEKRVRKILRKLYGDGYGDGERAAGRIFDSYYSELLLR